MPMAGGRLSVEPTAPRRKGATASGKPSFPALSQASGRRCRRVSLARSWLVTGCKQLVCGIDHGGPAVLDTDPAAEPEPRPAIDACDMRAAVEQGDQVPGRVLDFVGEHGVLLGGADLDTAHPSFDGGSPSSCRRCGRAAVARAAG